MSILHILSVSFGLTAYLYSILILFNFSCWLNLNHFRLLEIFILFPPIAGYGSVININMSEAEILSTILMNLIPILLFCVLHIIMARKWLKTWLSNLFIGYSIVERSVYIFVASLSLHYLMSVWKPINVILFSLPDDWFITKGITCMPLFGIIINVVGSFNIDHLELFGLKQSCSIMYSHHSFVVKGLYSIVRHPLMTGFFLMLWGTPSFTIGRLLINISFTIFIVIAVFNFEEIDLILSIGSEYILYRESTPPFFPNPWKRKIKSS